VVPGRRESHGTNKRPRPSRRRHARKTSPFFPRGGPRTPTRPVRSPRTFTGAVRCRYRGGKPTKNRQGSKGPLWVSGSGQKSGSGNPHARCWNGKSVVGGAELVGKSRTRQGRPVPITAGHGRACLGLSRVDNGWVGRSSRPARAREKAPADPRRRSVGRVGSGPGVSEGSDPSGQGPDSHGRRGLNYGTKPSVGCRSQRLLFSSILKSSHDGLFFRAQGDQLDR